MGNIVKGLQGGADDLQAWSDQEAASPRVLGEGADPAVAIPAAVKAEVKAVAQQAVFDKIRSGGNGQHKGELFIRRFDGTRYPESEWLPGEAMEISQDFAEGRLDKKTGCSLEPTLGYCCVNKRFYKHDNWPEGEPWRT